MSGLTTVFVIVVQMIAAEDELIGICAPKSSTALAAAQGDTSAVARAARGAEQRYVTQEQYEQQYRAALVSVKSRIKEVEGPDMKENMAEKIRDWFVACRDQTGALPVFPDAEAGSFGFVCVFI
jgi:hypothetical protein